MPSTKSEMTEVGDQLARVLPTVRNSIFRMSKGMKLDPDEVNDILQDTLVKLAHHLQSGIVIRNIEAYVWRVARNTLMDAVIRRRRIMTRADALRYEGLDATENLSTSSEEAESEVVLKTLQKAISALPTEIHDVFLLHYQSGLTIAEIAQRRNLTASEARALIAEGVAELSTALSGRGQHSHSGRLSDKSR
jgi:RNA polymerase sigma factor (sigma-70 family)